MSQAMDDLSKIIESWFFLVIVFPSVTLVYTIVSQTLSANMKVLIEAFHLINYLTIN